MNADCNNSSSWRGNGGNINTDNIWSQHSLSFIVGQFAERVKQSHHQPRNCCFRIYMENTMSGERVPYSEVTNRVVTGKLQRQWKECWLLSAVQLPPRMKSKTGMTVCKGTLNSGSGETSFQIWRMPHVLMEGNFFWLVARRIYSSKEIKGELLRQNGKTSTLTKETELFSWNIMDITKDVNKVNNGIRTCAGAIYEQTDE